MKFWKVPVKKIEYSFVIIKSSNEPTDDIIQDACSELNDYDWTDTEYDQEDESYEVDANYANEYNIFIGE